VKKSGHHYDDKAHEKRKRAKADKVQPGLNGVATVSSSGTIGLSGGNEISDDMIHEQRGMTYSSRLRGGGYRNRYTWEIQD
jgi:hypothetical protein